MRPVTGYQAFDGTFHEDANSCLHYEACVKIIKAIKGHQVLPMFANVDIDIISKGVFLFIQENKDAIKVFLETLEPSLLPPEAMTRWEVAEVVSSNGASQERS